MSARIFVSRFESFINKITSLVKAVDSTTIYAVNNTLEAGANVTVDLKTKLPKGTTINDYHIQTAVVDLKVIDPENESPFKGQAVNAVGLLSYGIDANGILTLRNYHNATVTYWLRVLRPVSK